jgi:hypothetical protein
MAGESDNPRSRSRTRSIPEFGLISKCERIEGFLDCESTQWRQFISYLRNGESFYHGKKS